MLNYRDLYLSDCDLQILDSISSGAVLTLNESTADFLLSVNFIAPYTLSGSGNQYVITPEGLRFREFWNKQKERAQKEKRRESIQIWVPIIVSNIIALMALLISALK